MFLSLDRCTRDVFLNLILEYLNTVLLIATILKKEKFSINIGEIYNKDILKIMKVFAWFFSIWIQSEECLKSFYINLTFVESLKTPFILQFTNIISYSWIFEFTNYFLKKIHKLFARNYSLILKFFLNSETIQ